MKKKQRKTKLKERVRQKKADSGEENKTKRK